jgi:hypothetical protein
MNVSQTLRLSAALLALLLAGCRPSGMEDYKQMVRSGLQTMPWPLEIEQVFGDADHFLTHWNFAIEDPLQWNTEVYFGGRFWLTMQVETEVDYWKRTVVRTVKPPKFYLFKVASVTPFPNGGVKGKVDKQWEFGEAEWQKLVAAKGDWAAIGISLGDTNPVPNFDTMVKAQRAPRVRVK